MFIAVRMWGTRELFIDKRSKVLDFAFFVNAVYVTWKLFVSDLT